MTIVAALSVLCSPASFGQRPPIDPGIFDKDIYTNHSLGFTLKLAPGLTQDKAAMAEAPHSWEASTLISAWTDKPWGTLRPGMVLFADRLSQFPENRRTTDACLARLVQLQIRLGYTVVQERVTRKIGDKALLCADFKQTLVRETVCVATRREFELVFAFTGSDERTIEKFTGSTLLNYEKE